VPLWLKNSLTFVLLFDIIVNIKEVNVKKWSAKILLATLIVFIIGCAPTFSTIQSAKLVDKGKFEVTPSFSMVYFSDKGSMEHYQDDYGLQIAYGLENKSNFHLRYEFINVPPMEELYGESISANVLGFGPKIGIVKDRIAFCLPIGFAFGGNIEDISDTWEFHPTLIATLPVSNNFEFNPSSKVLVPLSGDSDILIAFNLGAGISTNLDKWAIRPEAGFLLNPGEEGHFTHVSIGVTVYP